MSVGGSYWHMPEQGAVEMYSSYLHPVGKKAATTAHCIWAPELPLKLSLAPQLCCAAVQTQFLPEAKDALKLLLLSDACLDPPLRASSQGPELG